jgi:class 3 adenylate cyclase
MDPLVRLESRHDLPFAREAIWPVLSKTDWLNRSVGLPPVAYQFTPRTEGGSEVKAEARLFGRAWRWREQPFEWIEPEFYHVRRIFETGPFLEGKIGLDLLESASGTIVVFHSELLPRNAFGRWLALRLLGPRTEAEVRRILAHLAEYLHGRASIPLPRLQVHPVDESALQLGLQKLHERGQAPDLVSRLEVFLRESPDVDLSHIRPLAIARKWGRDPWEVLRLFLHAPSCGLLDLRWEILCPNCRGSRALAAASLSELKSNAHCDACQIKFDAEFDKSVELKFSIHPSIRPLEDQTYCLAGPGGRPHIVSQLPLEPLEERNWKLPEFTVPLLLRSPQVKTPTTVPAEATHSTSHPLSIICEPTGFVVRPETRERSDGHIRVRNPNPFPVLLSLEQAEWSQDILTAARVTSWQDFRDLFANEVISPLEQVTVGSQVVLFTDLRGSTAMYHDLGDPRAYALVRNHFSVLVEAVRAHHGTVVKTIGDAVMAAFYRVDEALAAVRQMHQKLPAANPNPAAPLVLKSSLHIGPCLVVNANEKLDLFGTTINLAARLVDCCHGGDLTVSDDLFHRPETAVFVRTLATPPEKAEVKFRGFDAPHQVWRLQVL